MNRVKIVDGLSLKSHTQLDKSSSEKRIRGFVRALLDGKLVHETDNLVVYSGSEFAIARMFYVGTSQGAPNDQFKDSIVTHFCVGYGSSVIDASGNPVVSAPTPQDTIGQITSNRAYSMNGAEAQPNYVNINDVVGAAKRIVYVRTTSSVDTSKIQVITNTVTERKTEIVLNCVVEPDEPAVEDDYAKIDEAWLITGLFDGSTFTPVDIFAHVTFPPIWKPKTGTLTIEWHILT